MDNINPGTMTRKQIAQYLNLSLPMVARLERRKENPLPCLRVGKKVLYPIRMVDEWLARESRR
jgi:excisionase family DNA binding protein